MSNALSHPRRAKLLACLRMPSVQTMVSRKSSITNAFVNSVIPAIEPTAEEIAQALAILELAEDDLRCAYCGDLASEWDHLRALVDKLRPTGFITEIGNLVPSCGKCNQSKGNKPWKTWMLSAAPRSPSARGVRDLQQRVARIERYERWRPPTRIDFEQVLGREKWHEYWQTWNTLIARMREAQEVANGLRDQVASHMEVSRTPRGRAVERFLAPES